MCTYSLHLQTLVTKMPLITVLANFSETDTTIRKHKQTRTHKHVLKSRLLSRREGEWIPAKACIQFNLAIISSNLWKWNINWLWSLNLKEIYVFTENVDVITQESAAGVCCTYRMCKQTKKRRNQQLECVFQLLRLLFFKLIGWIRQNWDIARV